jgi:PhnB protein
MKMNPYLSFNGDCEAAFKFYEKCFGGKIVMKMTNGDSPMAEQTPADRRDKIMHIRLEVGDIVLMGSDVPPNNFKIPQGMEVNLQFDNIVEAERVFQDLAENGTVKMPIQETFWAARFGLLVDRFGTPWLINCNLPA